MSQNHNKKGKESILKLGVSDLHAQSSEFLHILHLLLHRRRLARNEMRLHAHTINANPIRLQELHDILACTIRLRCHGFHVIIIVIQLRAGISSRSRLEGNLDVIRANDIQKYIFAVGTVLVEGLVEHVPGVALPFPVRSDGGDVVNHGGGEGLDGPVGGCHPGGELGVPDEVVAAQELLVLLCEAGDYFAVGEVEDALFGLSGEPLLSCQLRLMCFFPHLFSS